MIIIKGIKKSDKGKQTDDEDDWDDSDLEPKLIPEADQDDEGDWDSEEESSPRTRRRRRPHTFLFAALLAVLLCTVCATALCWKISTREKPQSVSAVQNNNSAVPTPAALPELRSQEGLTVELDTNQKPAAERTFLYFRSLLSTDEANLYDTVCAKLTDGEIRIDHLFAQDADQILRVTRYVLFDHPEFFWLGKGGGSVTWISRGSQIEGSLELKPLLDASKRELVRKRLETLSAQIKRDFGKASDYEKALGVYEYIIDNTIYDGNYDAQSLSDIMLNGRGVCAGYASLTQYLLQQLGIPSVYVSGTGNRESHAWNIVQLDGAWYQMDTTWGDPVGQNIGDDPNQTKSFAYFCLTDDEMYLNHTPDSTYLYPRCTATACNYYVHEGRFTDCYDEDWLLLLIRRDQGKEVEFRSASRQVFEEYKNLLDSQRFFMILEPVYGNVGGCTYHKDEQMRILSVSLK